MVCVNCGRPVDTAWLDVEAGEGRVDMVEESRARCCGSVVDATGGEVVVERPSFSSCISWPIIFNRLSWSQISSRSWTRLGGKIADVRIDRFIPSDD